MLFPRLGIGRQATLGTNAIDLDHDTIDDARIDRHVAVLDAVGPQVDQDGRDRQRVDWSAGEARKLDDAEPDDAGDLGYVGGERHVVTLFQRSQHLLEGADSAFIEKAPAQMPRSPNCAHSQPFGGDRIAVGIDAKNGQVMTRGWESEGNISALELAQEVAALGVQRIIYTDVARDGMLTGVNIEQTCMIARESGLKVTASGGVSSLEDLKRLRTASGCGIDSVIVGKALYEGRFTLKEAMQTLTMPA